MVDKVLKKDDFLKKTNWQRKTYPLKLNLTDIQQLRIEHMIYESKKVTNKTIQIIIKDFLPKYLIRISEEDVKENICPLCQKKKKLRFQLSNFKFVKYTEKNYKPVFKKGNKELICEMCHCSHYSLRKFLLPSSKRDIPIKEWDITKGSRLNGTTLFDSLLQKAVETIKSQEEIKKKIDWKIKFYRQRILDNTVKLNKESNKSKNDKQLIKKLKNYIRYDEKSIEKEKNKKAEDIIYKNDAIRLYENTYDLIKQDKDYLIKLKDYINNKWLTLEFYGKNHQKKLADKFIKSKNAETEIIRKGDDFYLQYIYRKEIEVPVPDKTFTSVGIDVNIINLACCVSMNKDLKPINTNFFSGRRLRAKRKRYSEVRKIWNTKTKQKEKGGKGRSKKWFKKKCDAQNERRHIKYVIHLITTKIVQDIKDKYKKPVIVLENLKDIRDRIGKELKISEKNLIQFLKDDLKKQAEELYKKRKFKDFRDFIEEHISKKKKKSYQKKQRDLKSLNRELNNWNFDDFQKFIEYKSKWLGIPVVYVPAKNTSIKCNKCGHTEEENYLNYHEVSFKCKKCDYECNADFNAGVNIARLFYDSLS